MTTLSDEQLEQNFRRDGFVYMPGFLSEEEVKMLQEHLDDFIESKVPIMPPEHVFYEDKNDKATLKQLQTLYSYDDFFKSVMFNSKFEALASVLLNDTVVGKNLQYFNKPPLVAQYTPPHQDGYYFMLEPNEAVTMWLGLEEVDVETGCVRYIKGSHLKGMREHARTNTLGFSQGIVDFGTTEDKENEVYFKSGPGDLFVHHSLTIHRADKNNSNSRTRKALGFIYYSSKAKENKIAKEAYQQKLAKELKEKSQV